jgi:hypothetical protein
MADRKKRRYFLHSEHFTASAQGTEAVFFIRLIDKRFPSGGLRQAEPDIAATMSFYVVALFPDSE